MGLWIYNSSVLLLLDSASSRGKALRIQTLRRFLGRCIQQLSTWIWFIVELSSPIFLLLPMAIVAERLDESSDENGLLTFSPGRLAFKEEGAGKVRVFAIPNALKQALLRPAHDWCMKIWRMLPCDGTFNQTAPLARLSKRNNLFRFWPIVGNG